MHIVNINRRIFNYFVMNGNEKGSIMFSCKALNTCYQIVDITFKRNFFIFFPSFSGYSFQHELVVNTEYYFTSLMNIFSSLTTIMERVTTLYLMYSLYFKQPTKDFCKFRFTLSEWQKMKTFYNCIQADSKYLQACVVFWRLWQSNAFRLVGYDVEHYAQLIQNNRSHAEAPRFFKISSEVIGALRSVRSGDKGLVCAIETLQVGYNEMKDHFKTNFGECSSLRSIDVLKDIDSQLDNVNMIFSNDDDNQSAQLYLMDLMGNDSELSTDNEMFDKETLSKMNTHKLDELNIGSKRALLREKAMNQTSNEIRCFKSRIKQIRFQDSQIERTVALSEQIDANNCIKIEPTTGNYNVNDDGSVMITHPRKLYNRHNGSSVERQMINYPT